MRSYGEILYPLSDLNEIRHQSSSKNNIAENAFALGHETHNRFKIIATYMLIHVVLQFTAHIQLNIMLINIFE